METSSLHSLRRDARKCRSLLLIKMRYIGDTVLVTPLLGTLRQALPHTRLLLLVNRQSADIVRNHPHIDRLIAFDYDRGKTDWPYFLRFLLGIRRLGCDLVMDLTGNDRSALFSAMSGAGIRLGYEGGSPLRRLAYTHRLPNRLGRIHTVDHHLAMAAALGLPLGSPHPYLAVPHEDIRWIHRLLADHGIRRDMPIVVIHPGARRWYKSWLPERFAHTADRLMRRYAVQVVLSGGPGDEEACRRITSLAARPVVDLCGKVPLRRLPALMRCSALLIGNDSAPIHVATAVDTPVVALFGPTRWEDWQPRRPHDKTLGIAFPCRPCGHARPDCPLGEGYCMSQITEDMVWEAIEGRLRGVGIEKRSEPEK